MPAWCAAPSRAPGHPPAALPPPSPACRHRSGRRSPTSPPSRTAPAATRIAASTGCRSPTRPQRWYGTLVHTVLQALAARRQSGVDAGPDAAARLWTDAWQASRGPKGAHPELRALGESQLRRYAESPGWRDAEPLVVEQPFTLSVGAGEVTGRFDRVDALPGGEQVVIDYKTGPPREEETLRRDLQVRAYAVALARERQRDEATVELHWLQTAEISRMTFDSRVTGKLPLPGGEHRARAGGGPPSP